MIERKNPRGVEESARSYAARETSGLTRRRFLGAAGSILLLGAAGCGGGESGSGEETSGGSGGTRTIEHKFGSTEVSGTPERVVSVGFTDQDAILALGVVPAAMSRWLDDRAVWPWNEDELGGEEPETLVAGEPNFEQIATLEPDLIVGLSSGMTRETYDTLSQIAPTIDHSEEFLDFGVPWQETTRVVGEAVNRQGRATEVVSEVEGLFEEARRQNPEFEGTTAAIVLPGEDGTYYPYGTQDARARIMTDLGFEIPQEINDLAGDSFFATISPERFDLIDQEVLIWLIQTDEQEQAILDSEIYQQLAVVERGRDIFFRASDEEPIVAAFSYGTALSLPYLLDNLVPRLADTLAAEETTA